MKIRNHQLPDSTCCRCLAPNMLSVCKSSALRSQEWCWQKLCRLVFALRHRPGTGCLAFGSLPWSSLFRPGYLLPPRNVVVAPQNRVIMMVENLSSAHSLLCYRTPFSQLSMHLWLTSRKIGCISVASPGLSLEHMIGIALSIKMTSKIQSIISSICRLGYIWAFHDFQKVLKKGYAFSLPAGPAAGSVHFILQGKGSPNENQLIQAKVDLPVR